MKSRSSCIILRRAACLYHATEGSIAKAGLRGAPSPQETQLPLWLPRRDTGAQWSVQCRLLSCAAANLRLGLCLALRPL